MFNRWSRQLDIAHLATFHHFFFFSSFYFFGKVDLYCGTIVFQPVHIVHDLFTFARDKLTKVGWTSATEKPQRHATKVYQQACAEQRQGVDLLIHTLRDLAASGESSLFSWRLAPSDSRSTRLDGSTPNRLDPKLSKKKKIIIKNKSTQKKVLYRKKK